VLCCLLLGATCAALTCGIGVVGVLANQYEQLTCKEELGTSLADVNKRFGDAKRAWQEEQRAIEEAKRVELARLVAEHQRELQRPRAEIAHLEDKVMRLQMQVTDMAADVQVARKKEEAAREDALKARQEKDAITAEVRSLFICCSPFCLGHLDVLHLCTCCVGPTFASPFWLWL